MKPRIILTHLFAAALATAVTVFFYQRHTGEIRRAWRANELTRARMAVEGAIGERSDRLQRQLAKFGELAARDRDFAMRLLVENDRSAPEVTELAPHFAPPMGVAILELVDSGFTVLSSSHFPGNVGNSVSDKAKIPVNEAVFVKDNIKGRSQLTYQVRREFSIEGVRFHCFGGWVVDQDFLRGLWHPDNMLLVLKHGDVVVGTQSVVSLSEMNDGRAVCNNQVFLADSVRLPTPPQETTAFLLVLSPEDTLLPLDGRRGRQ